MLLERQAVGVFNDPKMNDRISSLLGEIGAALFSTAQWGGRAYKLPGPGGNRGKPKLLAFLSVTNAGDAVSVSFKLPPARAAQVVEERRWIAPHSFRTLAPSGWVSATVSNRRRIGPLRRLLEESRSLHPVHPPLVTVERRGAAASTNTVARRIDRVMGKMKAEGWSPPADDGFEA